jgi:hypothetical protein
VKGNPGGSRPTGSMGRATTHSEELEEARGSRAHDYHVSEKRADDEDFEAHRRREQVVCVHTTGGPTADS